MGKRGYKSWIFIGVFVDDVAGRGRIVVSVQRACGDVLYGDDMQSGLVIDDIPNIVSLFVDRGDTPPYLLLQSTANCVVKTHLSRSSCRKKLKPRRDCLYTLEIASSSRSFSPACAARWCRPSQPPNATPSNFCIPDTPVQLP